jgi:hypothetical protein
MTNKELQELLKQYPDGLPVKFCWDEYHWNFGNLLSVNEVFQAAVLKDHILLIPNESGHEKIYY